MNSDEIKQIRKQTGLSAEKFGELVGVGKKTVESWEQGVRNPSGPARKILESMR
jgi:putative transcriptional regulator